MKISEFMNFKIEAVGSYSNAREYECTTDKFVFCLDLLDLSLVDDGDEFCDRWVNRLEDFFDALNQINPKKREI